MTGAFLTEQWKVTLQKSFGYISNIWLISGPWKEQEMERDSFGVHLYREGSCWQGGQARHPPLEGFTSQFGAGCRSLAGSLTSPAVICLLQETRLKEGIVRLQPQEEPLRSELLSGKFTVLVRAESCLASLLMEVWCQHAREDATEDYFNY